MIKVYNSSGRIIPVLWLLVIAGAAFPNVTMNKIFSNNMVLQHGMPVPVWGTASSGENVSVQFNGQTKSAGTGANGTWRVTLDSMEIRNSPMQMVVKGANTITLTNVLIGDVWLCSGQSNMAHNMDFFACDTNLAAGMNSVRISNGSSWAVCAPTTVGSFSATAFFYGKVLYDSLKIPIGLIVSAYGGSRIECWLTIPSILADPDLDTSMIIAGVSAFKVGNLYKTSIAPLIPFAIRGAVWYQGESNTSLKDWPEKYNYRFEKLISGWRSEWGQGDFPFYYVQLPNFKSGDDWPTTREAQRCALRDVKNTGMAIILDIGDSLNVHPADKADVGYRLGLVALSQTYGHVNSARSGPLVKRMYLWGDTVHVSFDNIGSGLTAKNGTLSGFEITSNNINFVAATAAIQNNEIIVYKSGTKVSNARYAWTSNPTPSLFNREGLPATPFRTYFSDTSMPELNDAIGSESGTVTLRFSERVTVGCAIDISNFKISNGVTVSSAKIQPDMMTVVLQTSALQKNNRYVLTLSGIKDLANNFYSMPQTQKTFFAGPASVKLTGTVIGKGLATAGNGYQNALDNNTTTFSDCTGDTLYAGYDFGVGADKKNYITGIRYMPRLKNGPKMLFRSFEASQDGITWLPLYSIISTPIDSYFVTAPIAFSTAFRFVRYNGTGGNLDASEIEFYGFSSDQIIPVNDGRKAAENSIAGSHATVTSVKIYDLTGRCVLKIKKDGHDAMSLGKIRVNSIALRNGLLQGMYVVQFGTSDNAVIAKKMMRF
jgi:sialate O-acetylesterase